jgi:hypothetical protein
VPVTAASGYQLAQEESAVTLSVGADNGGATFEAHG